MKVIPPKANKRSLEETELNTSTSSVDDESFIEGKSSAKQPKVKKARTDSKPKTSSWKDQQAKPANGQVTQQQLELWKKWAEFLYPEYDQRTDDQRAEDLKTYGESGVKVPQPMLKQYAARSERAPLEDNTPSYLNFSKTVSVES